MTHPASADLSHSPAPAPKKIGSVRLIAAVSAGNALEWFDILIYGFLAAPISRLFFPSGNETVSLLIAFGVFGIAFLVRPLGSVVIGAYADRRGRKQALNLCIGLMTAGTFLIVVLPTYGTIGLAAPVGLTLARMIQGFSAGGEFGSATAFLAEQNPARRGFYSSWQLGSQGLSVLLASGFALVLNSLVPKDTLLAWAWRVPFVFGLLVGPVALYIRNTFDEGAEYRAVARVETPLRAVLADQKLRLATGMGVIAFATINIFTMLYMPVLASTRLGLPATAGFAATVIFGLLELVFTPLFGLLSDRIGRTPIMLGASLAVLVTVIPAFALLDGHPTVASLIAVQALVGVLNAAYLGPCSAVMSELFPVGNRATGLSISYGLGVAIFGGFAPLIVAWLVSATASGVAPSFYVVVGAFISLAALATARRLGVR